MKFRSGFFFAPLLFSSFLVSCVSGAPPGFPKDKNVWTAPLVGALENDLYLVPVYINNNGPFLFQIDPDSRSSAIDEDIKNQLDIWTLQQADGTTEADKRKQVMVADVKKISVGDLSVRRKYLYVLPNDVLSNNGRRIRGVLGRDIIADSLLFTANRDTATMTLATHENYVPPAGATPLKYNIYATALERYYRVNIATVRANSQAPLALHLDLGGRTSSIWREKQKELKLPSLPFSSKVVDEFGVTHQIEHGSLLASVDVNGLVAEGVQILDYHDKKFRKRDLDGSLAQNFFHKFNVTADWHKKTIWLSKRAPVENNINKRLARWGGELLGCATPVCVSVNFTGRPELAPLVKDGDANNKQAEGQPANVNPPGGTEGAPGTIEPQEETLGEPLGIEIRRSQPGLSQSYEVLLGAVDQDGHVLGLPQIVATLPAGRAVVTLNGLDPSFANAVGFAVLDMTKVGMRECNGLQCAWVLKTGLFH